MLIHKKNKYINAVFLPANKKLLLAILQVRFHIVPNMDLLGVVRLHPHPPPHFFFNHSWIK